MVVVVQASSFYQGLVKEMIVMDRELKQYGGPFPLSCGLPNPYVYGGQDHKISRHLLMDWGNWSCSKMLTGLSFTIWLFCNRVRSPPSSLHFAKINNGNCRDVCDRIMVNNTL